MRMRATLPALLLTCCLAACGASAAHGGRSHTRTAARAHARGRSTGGLRTVGLTSGGHHRIYLLYVPPGDASDHRLPLVLVYHGALDTAAHTTGETDLLAVAEHRHNMILVFPQGFDDTWNEGAGHTPAERAGINDVAFTASILQRVESNYYVDPRFVVATGFSNGALLTEYLGCRLAAQLTLIVPVEGQLPVSVAAKCHPAAPINVYEVHATADKAIPYRGGGFAGVGGGTTVLSAPESVKRWAALDQCSGQQQSAAASSGVALSRYSGCHGGVGVTLATVEGGSHAWPSGFAETLLGVISKLPGTRRASP